MVAYSIYVGGINHMKIKKRTLKLDEITFQFRCTNCSEMNEQTFQDACWTGGSQECECCGSHGDVKTAFSCKHCSCYHEVELSSW